MSRTALADELSLVLRLLAQLQGDAAPPKKGLKLQAGLGCTMLSCSAGAACPHDCAFTCMSQLPSHSTAASRQQMLCSRLHCLDCCSRDGPVHAHHNASGP